MSIRWVNTMLRTAFGIDPTAKLILIILAEHANDDGVAWPSVETIAKLACITTRRAHIQLKALKDAGWFVADENVGGRHRTTRRRLVQPRKTDAGVSVSKSKTMT